MRSIRAPQVRKGRPWRPRLELLEARRLLSVWADFDGDGYDDLAVGVPFEDVSTEADGGTVNVIYGSSQGLNISGNHAMNQGVLNADPLEDGDRFGTSLAAGDFNNDGYADLAVGIPYEDVGAIVDAGAVHIILGSPNGLINSGNKIWHQDKNRVRDIAEAGDRFGYALAAGDYNGDNYVDLAIGIPFEDVGAIENAGAVYTLYGGPSGLLPQGNLYHQDTPNVEGAAEANDYFGITLAAGRFDAGVYDDLAIGVWGEAIGTASNAGAVNVLYGSAGGITAANDQVWHQDVAGIAGVSEVEDQFGYALAAGDFNADSYQDLAIGAPGETVGAIVYAGAVNILNGSVTGLTVSGNELFTQDSTNVPDAAEFADLFGASLAAADFSGDGDDDLIIGIPLEDYSSVADAGEVIVMYGGASTFGQLNTFFLQSDLTGSTASNEAQDFFGDSLATGDFDNDGRADLAIGTPGEDINVAGQGAVWAMYGDPSGLSTAGNQFWHQDIAGIMDSGELDDNFGSSVGSSGGRGNGHMAERRGDPGPSGDNEIVLRVAADVQHVSDLVSRTNMNGTRPIEPVSMDTTADFAATEPISNRVPMSSVSRLAIASKHGLHRRDVLLNPNAFLEDQLGAI